MAALKVVCLDEQTVDSLAGMKAEYWVEQMVDWMAACLVVQTAVCSVSRWAAHWVVEKVAQMVGGSVGC